MTQVQVPTFEQLMNPIIQALKKLGGSGTIEEINRVWLKTVGRCIFTLPSVLVG
jgi:hypothetical protein